MKDIKKQRIANQQNALLSTGAITEEGKSIVSKNAINHDIFTNDIIIRNDEGKKSLKGYNELLDNIVQSLIPNNQMENVLVEKIAVDIWRVGRVIRFDVNI